MTLKKREKEHSKALKDAVENFYGWSALQRATALLAVLDILRIRFEDDDGENTLEQLSAKRCLDLFDLGEHRWLGDVSALRETLNEAEYAIPINEYRLKEAKARIKRHKKQFKRADDADLKKFLARRDLLREREAREKEKG